MHAEKIRVNPSHSSNPCAIPFAIQSSFTNNSYIPAIVILDITGLVGYSEMVAGDNYVELVPRESSMADYIGD